MTDHATSTKANLSLQQTLSPPNTSGSPAWSISFTPDAKYIAVCYGCPNTCVKVWRCHDGAPSDRDKLPHVWRPFATIATGHTRSIRDVQFAPISNSSSLILATASFDGMVMIWEADACISFDELNDSSSDDEDVAEIESRFEAIAQLEGHESEVKAVAWNQTGSLLASCGRDKTVWVWECFLPGTVGGGVAGGSADDNNDGDFECLAVLQGHDGDVKTIVFAPSHGQWGEGEEILISASYDNSIRIWAEESGDWYCAATLGPNNNGPVHTSTVWSLAIAPSGVRFLSGSEDGSIAIWKMYTASERKQMQQAQYVSTDGMWNVVGILSEAHHGYAVLSLDCASTRAGHGRIVSGGGDDTIRVYREVGGNSDEPKFDVDASFEHAHLGDVNCVRWHPRDGRCLVSCGDDGAIRFWRYEYAQG